MHEEEKKFDYIVYIGRFQPFHKGHQAVIQDALKISNRVICVIGSAGIWPTPKNPFSAELREAMISESMPRSNIDFIHMEDCPYDFEKWQCTLQRRVVTQTLQHWQAGPIRVGIIGHKKDDSSFYLDHFPNWELVELPKFGHFDATNIRDMLYDQEDAKNFGSQDVWKNSVPQAVTNIIDDWLITWGEEATPGDYPDMVEENKYFKEYKEMFSGLMYPPTHYTADAVVYDVHTHKVLVVERKFTPGRGAEALPGGFVNQDETSQDAAIRELKEETGLDVEALLDEDEAIYGGEKLFDDPNRSLRGRVVTATHKFIVDSSLSIEVTADIKPSDDASECRWIDLSGVQYRPMFEDHRSLILETLKKEEANRNLWT